MKILGLCAVAALLAAPAAVQAADQTVHIAVRHGDLNLSNPADAARMMQRLDKASLSACGASSFSLREVREATRRDDCYQAGLNRAVADLNAPLVTAILRDHTSLQVASR
ncbi:UrcA family protein [Phenylobacterium immobile]|uniref:UrcA family protein n=1 Tax=Phenylobacterium immobile TaxID=21 RepID=UPI000B02B830|nr:UrcA family protein [Phenylobacterium immobile]